MFWLEANSQMHQLLTVKYPADLEESPEAAPEEEASINVLAEDLECEAGLELADMSGGRLSGN